MNLVALFEEAIEFQNFNGTVLSNGKVRVFYIGRTSLADIYNDVAGEYPSENPKILDNLGMGPIYVNPAFDYEIVVYDEYDNELFSVKKYLHSSGAHSTSNVEVVPSENIQVSAWTVGEVQIYQPYLVGEVGKTYEGISPIVVNNDEDKISANHVALGLQEPLFFVQDDENACIIGCSAQTEIPSSVSSKWEDASNTVSSNSAQWGIGTVYSAGDYIDIQDDVISVTGLQPAGDYAYNSAVSSKLDTTAFSTVSGDFLTTGDSAQFYTNDNPSGFITGVDLSDYATTGDLANKLDTTAFSNVSGDFITALPADLVYTGDLSDYATKDFVNDNIDSATSGLLPTSSFSSVSGSFLTALPSDLVYTADITGKLDTSVYATDSAMFSGAIDYVSANISDPVTSPLGTILVNGSEIEATNSAINLTGFKTPYTSSIPVNLSELYEFYPLNFGTFNTGSILTISSDGYGYNPKPDIIILGNDSANNPITLEFRNQSGSLGNIVSAISASLFEGQPTGYNFELSSYTLGSGVDELAWKSELNDLPGYDYLQANYQPKSAMTAYLTQVGALQNFQLKQNMTAYQPVSGMSAYLTTGDSANFYTTANESGFITNDAITGKQDITGMTAYQEAGNYYSASNPSGFITNDAITGKQDVTGMTAYQPVGNYYSASNPSGFITGIPDDLTLKSLNVKGIIESYESEQEGVNVSQTGIQLYNDIDGVEDVTITAIRNWNSTYNTVSTNSASWTASTIPSEVTAAASAVSSNSATWNSVTDKLDTTAFSTVSSTFLTAHQDLSDYQTIAGMTAYQPAGDYLTTADSAQFITALPADLVYTADITGFATTADLTSKLDKSDSANFYTTANESGFITGIPNEVTDAASTVASNSANWNSTYNTVNANSADWSVSEEISGTNGIKISESADKVIIEVSASYATEDWVTGQGYITGINYNTGSI